MPDNKILLIDPFENLVNAYRMILEEEEYVVETALNVREAYELLRNSQYSLIITEYVPPFETTEYMIESVKKKSPETYIIMVSSAFVEEETYERLFSKGLDDFILKPYSPEKILVHIRKGFRQRDLIQKLQKLESVGPGAQEIQEIIFNEIFFKKCLRQELKRAKRHHRAFSLLLLPLPLKGEMGDRFDHFYIHIIKMIRRNTREEDMIGKNNGEIGLILPETDQIGSRVLVQRLLDLIKNYSPFKSDSSLEQFTQSLYFQSFTYPDEFSLPDSLRSIVA